LLDVFDDRAVGWGAVQRYQDGVIHDLISGSQRLMPGLIPRRRLRHR
jgi:hypothetical protein